MRLTRLVALLAAPILGGGSLVPAAEETSLRAIKTQGVGAGQVNIIEHIVRTPNAVQPTITLFLRLPDEVKNAAKTKGVLALCLLGDDPVDIRNRLYEMDQAKGEGRLMRFAVERKLAILCWGSRRLWNPYANWDEQTAKTSKQMDEAFDDVSAAWAKGVDDLCRKHELPNRGFVMWGLSESAQYGARLALRIPHYFLAVHIHVPSSFDQPTPEANGVLWCLTTGDKESGYDRSLRFQDRLQETA